MPNSTRFIYFRPAGNVLTGYVTMSQTSVANGCFIWNARLVASKPLQ